MSTLIAVANFADVPDGWSLAVDVRGRRLAVSRCGDDVHALDGDCPHAGGPLGDSRLSGGCELRCPWHGASFDVRTGEPMGGPARSGPRRYATTVVDGVVYVDLDHP